MLPYTPRNKRIRCSETVARHTTWKNQILWGEIGKPTHLGYRRFIWHKGKVSERVNLASLFCKPNESKHPARHMARAGRYVFPLCQHELTIRGMYTLIPLFKQKFCRQSVFGLAWTIRNISWNLLHNRWARVIKTRQKTRGRPGYLTRGQLQTCEQVK